MQETFGASVQGFIKIVDKDTGEILVDTHNDVLYGNMATALAHALIGNPSSFLTYIAFGNGGAYVSSAGSIVYKPSIGGAGSLIKSPTANLYNTVYVKKISNNSNTLAGGLLSSASITPAPLSANYEDIVASITLDYDEPAPGLGITQSEIDNSTFVGSQSSTGGLSDPDSFVFNEIGLFAGSTNVFVPDATETPTEVNNFIAQPSVLTPPASKSKLMLTHAIFHPIQKSRNRSYEIIYTLRIQMGAL